MSQKCGISLNLLVKDKRLNQITEYHTNDEQMTVKNIRKQLVGGTGQKPSDKQLRILTINIRDKFKEKAGGIVGRNLEDSELDSENDLDDEDNSFLQLTDKNIDLESENCAPDIQEGQLAVMEDTQEGIKKYPKER